jgi:hypothetical protein
MHEYSYIRALSLRLLPQALATHLDLQDPEICWRATVVIDHLRDRVSKMPSSPEAYWGAIDLRKERGKWKAYYYLVQSYPWSLWWLEDFTLPEQNVEHAYFPSSTNDVLSKSCLISGGCMLNDNVGDRMEALAWYYPFSFGEYATYIVNISRPNCLRLY